MPVSWVIFSVSEPFLFPEITCSVLWWKAHIHTEEHRGTGDTPVRDMKSCPSYSKAIPGQHQPRRLGRTHDPESARAALWGTAQDRTDKRTGLGHLCCVCVFLPALLGVTCRLCTQVCVCSCVPAGSTCSVSLLAGPEAVELQHSPLYGATGFGKL